jgi:1-deoxy-D-xylulose-5-phosphate synthase
LKYDILNRIDSPQDLKKLNIEELKKLSQEIRVYIVDVVSKTGGHLAPNLGVVELTLALHYVMNSPKDKIVWDVSHQAYVHKIITGRKRLFRTLRQLGGISGFTSREESEHDPYTTGHASTSIAYGMGLLKGMIDRGEDSRVAVVIGDGALTGGVAYEALNNLGHSKLPLIVILNDNEMSIAKNVGAISSYLSRIRLDPKYNKFREDVEKLLKSMPLVGETLYQIGDQLRESLKALLTPGVLFEEFGIRYFGPIDGHNIERLIKAISWVYQLNEPVILHVVTVKGKGYEPAEKHCEYFHGSSPFDPETGKPRKSSEKPSFTEVFARALVSAADENPDIVAITAAMPSGTGLNIFKEHHEKRFVDVGIAEQFAVTYAAGLAASGKKPVCAIYSTFLQRAYDQVIQDVCLQNLPVIFAIDRGGLVGEDGPTHHGVFDLTYLKAVPNLVVAAPATGNDLIAVLKTAVASGMPFAFRYPRGNVPDSRIESYESIKPAEIGKGKYLQKGKRIAIIAIGRPATEAIEAAKLLGEEGINITVFDALWLKPVDQVEIEKILKEHEIVLTVEENVLNGGFGEGVARLALSRGISTRIYSLGIDDRFIPHGKPEQLLHMVGIDSESIYHIVQSLLKNSKNGSFFGRIKGFLKVNGKD